MKTFEITTDNGFYEIRAYNYVDALDTLAIDYDDDSYVWSVDTI